MSLPEPSISQKITLEIFSTGSTVEICTALVGVTLNEEEDWQWVQEQCLNFLHHPEVDIRGLAATCLGHIARIHKKLDRERVISALKKSLNDKKIAGRVEDALSDIHHYLLAFEHPTHSWSALSTYEEWISEERSDPRDEAKIEEVQKQFPYTTIVKWGYRDSEMGTDWCFAEFGPKEGTWNAIWLGKTDYDFGYEQFFFKYKSDRDFFESGIRAIEYFNED